jgi:hypothetical protein
MRLGGLVEATILGDMTYESWVDFNSYNTT